MVGCGLLSRKSARLPPNLDIDATFGYRLSVSTIQYFDFKLNFLSVKLDCHTKNTQQERDEAEMPSPIGTSSHHCRPLRGTPLACSVGMTIKP